MCNLLGAAGSSAGKGRRGRRALGSEVCSRGGVSDRRRGARNQMLKCSPKLQPLLSLTVGKPPYHRHLRFMLYHVLDFSFLFPPPRTSLALRKLAFMMDIPRARLREGASQQPGGTGRREHRRDRAEPRRAERSRDTRGPAAQLPPTPAAHPAGESVSRYLSCRFSFCRPSSLFPPGTEPACHSPLAHTLPPWGC